jgi:hypothetical protein
MDTPTPPASTPPTPTFWAILSMTVMLVGLIIIYAFYIVLKNRTKSTLQATNVNMDIKSPKITSIMDSFRGKPAISRFDWGFLNMMENGENGKYPDKISTEKKSRESDAIDKKKGFISYLLTPD